MRVRFYTVRHVGPSGRMRVKLDVGQMGRFKHNSVIFPPIELP
jgi:hypothetical protein